MGRLLYSIPPSLDVTLLLTSFLALIPPSSADLTVYSNYFDPPPSPEDGPPLSRYAIRDPAYLPAQIGAIVGSYALSIVIIAAVLLLLTKKRRDRLAAAEAGLDDYKEYPFQFAFPPGLQPGDIPQKHPYPYPSQAPQSPIKNFSYPTPPTPSAEQVQTPRTTGGFSTYSSSTLGINPLVDQRVVAADREMAQQQLEEMYKYVMEHEAAKEAGTPIEAPPTPLANKFPNPTSPKQTLQKKSKSKPANLNLSQGEPERQSRASSLLSALRSPKKKSIKGVSISSPIMTPKSGTFPRYNEGEEMNAIPPRHYAPASPPPVPTEQPAYLQSSRNAGYTAPITPADMSPESTQSIDERIGAQYAHSRHGSHAVSEVDPVSAVSDRSMAPLMGLPSSPKPNSTRFPSLPSSPKPGSTFPASPRSQTFTRPNAPSAVRTGGTLPLRAYEPALSSPSAQTTKQTTFERAMPLSPGGMRTPWTGAPVPYTPYQPFSPVVPVTPSLVTKADRKRMRQLQPKTPTMEMVQDTEDVW